MFDGVTEKADLPLRDQIGDQQYMSCLDREYSFPVTVFQIGPNGERVEASD